MCQPGSWYILQTFLVKDGQVKKTTACNSFLFIQQTLGL